MAQKTDYIWMLGDIPSAPVISTHKKDYAKKQRRRFLFGRPQGINPTELTMSRQSLGDMGRDHNDTQKQFTSAVVSRRMRNVWASYGLHKNVNKEVTQDSARAGVSEARIITKSLDSKHEAGARIHTGDRHWNGPSKPSNKHSHQARSKCLESAFSTHDTEYILAHTCNATEPSTPTSTLSRDEESLLDLGSQWSVIQDGDDKAESWLAQGLSTPVKEAEERFYRLSKDWSRGFSKKTQELSLSRAVSPTTSPRKHGLPIAPFTRSLYPLSPMNNGRHVYGNYVSSDAQHYLAIQYAPTSPIFQNQPSVLLRGGWESPKKRDKIEPSTREMPFAHGINRNEKSRTPQRGTINAIRPESRMSSPSLSSTTSQNSGVQSTSTHSFEQNPVSREGLQHRDTDGGMRPLTFQDTVYEQGKIPTNGARYPSLEARISTLNMQSALQSHQYAANTLQRPEIWNRLSATKTTSTVDSHRSGRRSGGIWNGDLPLTLEQRRPDRQPDVSSLLSNLPEDDELDARSLFSDYAMSDNNSALESLNERLRSSGPYQDHQFVLREKAKQYEEKLQRRREEVLRGHEEHNRLERLHTQQDELSDTITVHPDDSISYFDRTSPTQGLPHRQRMAPIHENSSIRSSQQRPSKWQSIGPPTGTSVPVPPPHTASNKPSIQKALHIAGKLSRLLLAAPSSPAHKTLSRRHPHTLKHPQPAVHDFAARSQSRTIHPPGLAHLPRPRTTRTSPLAPPVAQSEAESRRTSETRWPEPLPNTGMRDWRVPHARRGGGLRGGGGGGGGGVEEGAVKSWFSGASSEVGESGLIGGKGEKNQGKGKAGGRRKWEWMHVHV